MISAGCILRSRPLSGAHFHRSKSTEVNHHSCALPRGFKVRLHWKAGKGRTDPPSGCCCLYRRWRIKDQMK